MRARGDVRGLANALRHRDADVRTRAASAIGDLAARCQTGDPATDFELTIEPLAAVVEGDAADAAAIALAQVLRVTVRRGRLEEMLRHEIAVARIQAARCLGALGDQASARALAAGLRDADEFVRRESVWALSRLLDARKRRPPAAVTKALASAAVDRDQTVRIRALWALGRSNEWDCPDALLAMSDEHEELRRTGASLLLVSAPPEDPNAIGLLASAVKDDDLTIRRAAFHTLTKQRDSRAFELFWRGLHDEDYAVQASAITGLAHLRSAESARLLVSALFEEDDAERDYRRRRLTKASRSILKHKRASITQALLEHCDLSTADALVGMLDRRPPPTKAFAERVLHALEISDQTAHAIAALRSDSTSDRQEAVWKLRGKKTEWERTALRNALHDSDQQVRWRATWALDGLRDLPTAEIVSALADERCEVRRDGATALGSRAEPAAVTPLAALLSDSAWEVRAAAARALGRIRDDRALRPLLSLLDDEEDDDAFERAIVAVAQLWSARNAPEIISALGHREIWVRWAVAWACGKMPTAAGAEALARAVCAHERPWGEWTGEATAEAEEAARVDDSRLNELQFMAHFANHFDRDDIDGKGKAHATGFVDSVRDRWK